MLQLTGHTDEALKIYTKALEKAPDDLDLKLRVGSTQVLSGFANKALPLLQTVHAKRPRSAEVNHFYGRALYDAENNRAQSLIHLKLAAQLDASRADYHLWVAIVANDMGDFATAETEVDAALAIDNNYADAFWQKGVTLQKKLKTRDALDVLQIALQKNPTLYEAHAAIAACYQDQTDYGAAEESWRKALEGDDTNALWHFRLAKLLVDRNARDEAVPHLEKAISLVKDNLKPGWLGIAHFLLAESIRTSKPKEALASYKQFIKMSKPDMAYREEAQNAIREIERAQLRRDHGGGDPPE